MTDIWHTFSNAFLENKTLVLLIGFYRNLCELRVELTINKHLLRQWFDKESSDKSLPAQVITHVMDTQWLGGLVVIRTFNSFRPSDHAYMHRNPIIISSHDLAPSHYLNQCWNIVNWTLRNKLQWDCNQNSHISIQENAFENVIWKMAPILSQPMHTDVNRGHIINSETCLICMSGSVPLARC